MRRQFLWGTCLLVAGAIFLSACAAPTGAPAQTESAAAPVAASGTGAESATTVGNPADWPEKFVMGFFGGDDADAVMEGNEPLRAYLEERLGIEVQMFTGTSYTAVIEAMRANRVDAMQVGPFSYVLAVQEAGAEALGVGVSTRAEPRVFDPTLPPHYYSVIFTKKGSGIRSIADLEGKDFNFVDPASTSGHLAPKTALIKLGIDPDTEMRTVFAGSHPTAVLAVWNDKAPAGATFETNLYRLRDEGQIDFCGFEDNQSSIPRTEEEVMELYDACPEGHIVMIAYSDPIPNTPFAVRGDLPESFKAAVKDAILDIQNDEYMITAMGRWYLDPAEELGFAHLDQYYNSLRDIATLLDLDLKELAEQ